jgi:hypothetical protein
MVVIDGRSYSLATRGVRDRYGLGWTPGRVTLTVTPIGPKLSRPVRFACISKRWTAEHELLALGGPRCGLQAVPHKVTLTQNDLETILRIAYEHGAAFTSLELPNWLVALTKFHETVFL